MAWNQNIEEFLRERGALKVGFSTLETLMGGPPSTDLSYKLEGARSAISFALPLERGAIRAFLAKEDRTAHERDNLETNLRAKDLSWELAKMLERNGYPSKGTAANNKYRQEIPGWQLSLPPDISHRYLAVRSGVGSFGWSGNVGIKGVGPAIILGTCLTTLELEPTPPVPAEASFCDRCKLCHASCAVEMFDHKAETSVTIGGVTFTHARRRNLLLCLFCCGGFTGLHRSGKWSTWSPGRFRLPETPEKLEQEFLRAVGLYARRPEMPGGYAHSALNGAKQYMTCGNCQIVCWGDKKETAHNVKLLHHSGCVLQRPDGALYVLPPEEATQAFTEMEPERRRLYC